MNVFFCVFSIIPPLIFHFELGHFTPAQTLESMKIGQALNRSSSLSLATPSIELPKTSKFELST
jgi:hypothetical protein